jgi:peptide/nickel transport system substrate-binding protein
MKRGDWRMKRGDWRMKRGDWRMFRIDLKGIAWRLGALASVGVLVGLSVSGCGGSGAGAGGNGGGASQASFYTRWPLGGTPVRGGRVVIDGPEAPTTLTAFKDGPAIQPLSQLYDELVELLPGKGQGSAPVLVPGLATSWSANPEHTIFTFHIRSGVRFSNGEPLTGEDVVFSLRQASSPLSFGHPFSLTWKKVTLIAPMVVQIQLSKPGNALLEYVDGYWCGIFSKKAYEREGEKAFALHPVATGPFMVKSVTPGYTSIKLVRNPYYWRKGQPYLNEVVFNQVESDNARILAVRSGAATIAQQIPYAQVAALRSVPGVKILVGPISGASVNPFNRAKAPFNEVNVRRALLYATPREQIIKSVYKGIGTPANSLWGQLKYWDSKVPLYPYDLTKAKELLKQSSLPNGFSTTIGVSSGESEGELLASILQSSWAKIGIHVTIQSLPSTTLYANFFAGKYGFQVWPPEQGFDIYRYPDAISLYFENTEPGFGPPASPKFVSRLNEAQGSPSEALRQKLFRELQYEGYQEEALFMPVVDLVSLNLVSDSLRGFQVLPSTTLRLEQAWLQK